MDVPNKVVFVLIVCVLQLAISNVAAVDYLVGDEKGWTANIDYRAWTKDKIFRVGDRLVFKYPTGTHNVVQVKRDPFKNCLAPPASLLLTSGNDVVELKAPGRKWYISGVYDHCSVGKQKLAINVFPASVHPKVKDMAPSPAYPVLPLPLIPWVPFIPGYQPSPSPAPAPSPSSELPPGWWKFMFPPSAAPAPSTDFPWKFMFPPLGASAPSRENPRYYMFPPAPSAHFSKKSFFSPPTAPAPSMDMPWKWMFPPLSPTLPPAMDYPWKWMFPPISALPSSSP